MLPRIISDSPKPSILLWRGLKSWSNSRACTDQDSVASSRSWSDLVRLQRGRSASGSLQLRGRKAASPNFYICVRFLSYHWSAGFWVQPPQPQPRLRSPLHSLHFPAHLRYCCCACFSSPCCSSGWALYTIAAAADIFDLTQRPLSPPTGISEKSVPASFLLGAVGIVALFVLVGNTHA